MNRCTKCGHENEPIFRFCLKCGTELARAEGVAPPKKPAAKPAAAAAPTKCPHCGGAATAERRFCVACGREVAPSTTPGARAKVGQLVVIQADGTDGRAYPLFEGATAIGGASGDHVFTDDALLAPHHADFVHEKGELRVYDRQSRTGVFVRLRDAVPLGNGSQIRIGQQLLEVHLTPGASTSGDWGEVIRLLEVEGEENRFPLHGENVFIGRERGHIVFPTDGYVSGSHAVVFRQEGRAMLKDLDSSNGTYVRIGEPTQLERGRLVLLGAHLFRVEI